MMNNRKVINNLENRNGILKLANKDLLKDMEKKEDRIVNLLDSIEDLQLDKSCLLEKISKLEQILEVKELKICELNTKLCRAEGQLDKIKNMYKMLTGEELE